MASFNANHNSLYMCCTTVLLIRSQNIFVLIEWVFVQQEFKGNIFALQSGLRKNIFYLTLYSEAFCSSNKQPKSESIQNELKCEGIEFFDMLRYWFLSHMIYLQQLSAAKFKFSVAHVSYTNLKFCVVYYTLPFNCLLLPWGLFFREW